MLAVFLHSCWDHLTLAEKLLGCDFRLGNLTLEVIRFCRLNVKFG